jgi:hypothetical protein
MGVSPMSSTGILPVSAAGIPSSGGSGKAEGFAQALPMADKSTIGNPCLRRGDVIPAKAGIRRLRLPLLPRVRDFRVESV